MGATPFAVAKPTVVAAPLTADRLTVTEPVGVPPRLVTAAVNVTVSPRRDGLSDDTTCTFPGSPNGIRTRAATLRGWCPWPLDDGAQLSVPT